MTLFVERANLNGQTVNLLVEDGRFAAIGPDVAAPAGAEVLFADGMFLTPPLVNGHTHAAMTLFRGFGDDMPLMEWLQTRIWPAEARLNEEDVYWGTRLACLEMIRSGTASFQDMYWHYHAVARAVEEAGLKAGVGAILIDVAGKDQGEHFKELALQLLEETTRYSQRITYTLTPHAIYTVGEKNLRWVAELSESAQKPVHIHLSETAFEVETCLANHGLRPAFYLDRVGLLTPRTLLAHGVHLDEAELDLIAQRGSTLVTNPVSNMKLAVGGVFPYQEAKKRGIPMGVGTDGAASNNSLDLFQDVKVMTLLQKHHRHDPTALPAHEAWDMATGARAPLLGQGGKIAVGEPADFLLINTRAVEISPNHDLVSNLVYAATGHVVDSMVVSGRILMHNRVIAHEAEIRAEAVACARAICND